MSGDDDFSEYVAARWPSLVRSAVLLGCSPVEAEDLVQTALERCLLKWERVRVAEDRNASVHRMLVNLFLSARRRRWTGERPAAVLPERAGLDQTTDVDDYDAVMRALDRLTRDQRTPVGPPPIEALYAGARRRRRRRTAAVSFAAAATVAIAAGGTALLVAPGTKPKVPAASTPPSTAVPGEMRLVGLGHLAVAAKK